VKIAVVSDVHSNLAALEAVLAAIDAEGVDELWCLGDLVGYNAEPDACVSLIAERVTTTLCGNHDLVVSGAISMNVFASDAGAAARWTQSVITPETLDYLQKLIPEGERHGVEMYHASIRDPVWEYVIDDRTAAVCLAAQHSPIALIGHSHVALMYGYVEGTFVAGTAAADSSVPLGEGPFLLNPGSVGQPRDGDPRAAFLVLDLDQARATWRRVEYDIARTQQTIRDAGLPQRLASRLADGR
jgi:predicted phosphodiesterase